jgi:hypothetical protein
MKQKKFSQIYKEAAESLFNEGKEIGCARDADYHIYRFDYRDSYFSPAQNYFSNLYFDTHEYNYWHLDTANKDCINHRITALLLASEIAKSEGL